MFKVRLGFVVFLGGLLLNTSLSCKGLDHERDKNAIEVKEKNPKSTENNAAKEVIIRQRISGGLIPLDREWIFYSNGEIRQPNGEITVLTERQLEDVLGTFQFFESEKIEKSYPAPIGSADFRTLELTLFYNDGIRKITIEDSSDQVPDIFWHYWDSLQDVAKQSLGNK